MAFVKFSIFTLMTAAICFFFATRCWIKSVNLAPEPKPGNISRQFEEPSRAFRVHSKSPCVEVNSTKRCLPAFVIFGVPKTGSTALVTYLTHNKHIYIPPEKEIHFFSWEYHRGIDWYSRFFVASDATNPLALVYGEASVDYALHPIAATRMKLLLPGVKLLYITRDPVERAWSAFRMRHFGTHDGWRATYPEMKNFTQCITEEISLWESCTKHRSPEVCFEFIMSTVLDGHRSESEVYYVLPGLYALQLRWWLRHFPRSSLLLLQSHRIDGDPAGVLAEVEQFLEDYRIRVNLGAMHPIAEEDRKRLEAFYFSFNQMFLHDHGYWP